MLIEFSVSNFRSFYEKQTLSMVAAPRLKRKENTFAPSVVGEKLPPLLKVAAIYGPNASGKSNLVRALATLGRIAARKPSTGSEPLPVVPFRFDKEMATQPSNFEVHFVIENQRFQFNLSATPERIVEERLTAFPKGKETLLYERRYTSNGEEYVFGDSLEGGVELHSAWRKLTGPQVLFLSQAVANSSEELKQLRPPLNWLVNRIGVMEHGTMREWARITQNLVRSLPRLTNNMAGFLQDVDVPVTSIRFEHDGASSEPLNLAEDMSEEEVVKLFQAKNKTTLTHKTALGEADFDFEEESDGTKGLVGFWLPWAMIGRGTGYAVLVVDELDSSLHPEIVANLVEKHLKLESPGQIIFTTHDTHLMDTKLLRRDQFWLTERDVNGATQLRSIHEFDGRESEDLEKRYYEGRYRALPVLRRV